MKDNKQTIKCEVESCKYNDEKGACELDEIQVGCDCDNDKCACTEETVCQSFEESDEMKNEEDDVESDDE